MQLEKLLSEALTGCRWLGSDGVGTHCHATEPGFWVISSQYSRLNECMKMGVVGSYL